MLTLSLGLRAAVKVSLVIKFYDEEVLSSPPQASNHPRKGGGAENAGMENVTL